MRIFVVLFLVAALVYLGICGAFFVFQRSMIYFPQPISDRTGTIITLENGGERIHVTTHPDPGPDALLYFGGNAEDTSLSMPDLTETFPSTAIYLMHYRGYGDSSGTPSEKGLFSDALALFDRVHAEHPNIVVVGRSLGSGVAVYLASQRPVARLVLVTPFDSLQQVAAFHYPYLPVRWLLRDKYESWRYAPNVTAQTLIIAAGEDEIIPSVSTELLRTRFKPGLVSYEVIPGVGHNTISESPQYLPLLKSR